MKLWEWITKPYREHREAREEYELAQAERDGLFKTLREVNQLAAASAYLRLILPPESIAELEEIARLRGVDVEVALQFAIHTEWEWINVVRGGGQWGFAKEHVPGVTLPYRIEDERLKNR